MGRDPNDGASVREQMTGMKTTGRAVKGGTGAAIFVSAERAGDAAKQTRASRAEGLEGVDIKLKRRE